MQRTLRQCVALAAVAMMVTVVGGCKHDYSASNGGTSGGHSATAQPSTVLHAAMTKGTDCYAKKDSLAIVTVTGLKPGGKYVLRFHFPALKKTEKVIGDPVEGTVDKSGSAVYTFSCADLRGGSYRITGGNKKSPQTAQAFFDVLPSTYYPGALSKKP